MLSLIGVLFDEIQGYYADRRSHPVNYENCCYVLAQLYDTESGEFDNPAVQPLIEKLRIRQDLNAALDSAEKRVELFKEAKHYIQDVAWRMLGLTLGSLDYLNWLVDAVCDRTSQSVDVFTLNHDLVLEHALRKRAVQYCDGFAAPHENVRFWEPARLEERDTIRLCKLHGSVDWFWFRSKRMVGIPQTDDLWDTPGRPEILIGTDLLP